MINNLVYSRSVSNSCSYIPLVSTGIGTFRVCIHFFSSIFNLVFAAKSHIEAIWSNNVKIIQDRKRQKTQLHLLKAYIGLREMIRGIIQIPPFLGNLTSYLWDRHCLSPAQKLALRIQEVYATRLHRDDSLLNDPELIDVDCSKINSEDFRDFINNQKVKMSTNQAKIDTLVKAFLEVNCKHEIFNDKKLPFYALAAFAQGKIDREDMATLLEFYTAKQCFPDCILLHLKYVPEELAASTFTTIGRKLGLLNGTPEEGRKTFHKLRNLPPHKQYFWSYESMLPESLSAFQHAEMHYSPVGSLYTALYDTVGIKTYDNRVYIYSFAMEREGLNLKYGKTNNPLKPKLGVFKPREITKAVMEDSARLCATFFPGISPVREIHGSLELPTTIIMHDKSHAEILQHCPPIAEENIKQLVRVFQSITGVDLSKEIWELLEMVAPTSFAQNEAFFEYFITDDRTKVDEISIKELFWQDNGEPTILYWIMYLNNENIQQAGEKYLRQQQASFICPILPEGSHISPENKRKLEEIKKLSSLTIKQKLWKLQQDAEAIPQDDQLEFRRIKKGLRKNTIVLVLKTAPLENTIPIRPSNRLL